MASANLQDTRNWRDWIQEDPGTAGHLIVKPPLKPVKPVPWSHMMAKRGDIASQSPWIGGNLARQIGPQWLCQHVDHLTKMANSTRATISDYKSILEDRKSVKSVELPFVKGMKDLDFATYDNLEKVTVSAPFPTSSLPAWLKVAKVTFDPRETKPSNYFGTSNASHLIVVIYEYFGMKELDMKEVAKMKKIETLEIIFGGWGDRVPLDDNGSEDHDGEGLSWHQLQPLLKTLRSCSNVQHLILGLRSYCCFHMGSLVELVRKYLPQISTLTINDTDETGYSLHSKDGPEMSNLISNKGPPNPSKPVGIFAFKNLQKITFDMKVSISRKGFHSLKSPSIENMKVFLEHMPKNEIKEVCFKNGHGDGMLNESFVMKLRQIFPCLEKLVIEPKIDSWDRDGDRCVILPKYLDLWSMENLVAILETIGSVKQLQISMTSELSAEPKMTREKKMKIFKVGLEIVKDQFPMDAELILIDRKSGCALKKEKLREAVIEENFRN